MAGSGTRYPYKFDVSLLLSSNIPISYASEFPRWVPALWSERQTSTPYTIIRELLLGSVLVHWFGGTLFCLAFAHWASSNLFPKVSLSNGTSSHFGLKVLHVSLSCPSCRSCCMKGGCGIYSSASYAGYLYRAVTVLLSLFTGHSWGFATSDHAWADVAKTWHVVTITSWSSCLKSLWLLVAIVFRYSSVPSTSPAPIYITVLIMGTPKKVPPILGNPRIYGREIR